MGNLQAQCWPTAGPITLQDRMVNRVNTRVYGYITGKKLSIFTGMYQPLISNLSGKLHPYQTNKTIQISLIEVNVNNFIEWQNSVQQSHICLPVVGMKDTKFTPLSYHLDWYFLVSLNYIYTFSTFGSLLNSNGDWTMTRYSGSVTGGRLNKKDRLSRYGDSHVKDKTAGRTSYL